MECLLSAFFVPGSRRVQLCVCVCVCLCVLGGGACVVCVVYVCVYNSDLSETLSPNPFRSTPFYRQQDCG